MVRWSQAEVSEQKVLGYLLAADHPVGGAKSVFFRALGYERATWTRLRDDLRAVGQQGEIVTEQPSRFGQKTVIDGVVRTPIGRVVRLRTVWISDSEGRPPRLVTAYPA
jgi:hypothetical protein